MAALCDSELTQVNGGGFWSVLTRGVTLLDVAMYASNSSGYLASDTLNHNSEFMYAATNRL